MKKQPKITKWPLDWLVQDLTEKRSVKFAYRKVSDGSIRYAHGTWKNLPPLKSQVDIGNGMVLILKEYKQNPNILKYFDLEAKAWRSFRKDQFLGRVF